MKTRFLNRMLFIAGCGLMVILSACKDDSGKVFNSFPKGEYLLCNGVESTDQFFYINFADHSFTGHTVCNSFSANYQLKEDCIVVSDFTCTDIDEADNLCKDFRQLVSDDFYYTLSNNRLVLKQNQIDFDFKPYSPNSSYLLYDYFQHCKFPVDSSTIFINCNDTESGSAVVNALMADLTLESNYSIKPQGAHSIYLSLDSTINSQLYYAIIESLNQKANGLYATVCKQQLYPTLSLRNYMDVQTDLNEQELNQLIGSLCSIATTIHYNPNNQQYRITINRLQKGFETLELSNKLTFVRGIRFITILYSDNSYQ